MKIETPQILWNSEADKGLNAPLYSLSVIESGFASASGGGGGTEVGFDKKYGHVLATAGNTNIINLWKVTFANDLPEQQQQQQQESSKKSDVNNDDNNNKCTTIFQKQSKPLTSIEYILSLTRHELSVNTVAFSPDGLHLVTAGEAGNIVVWSVPINKRGNGNGRHYWSTVSKESDLLVRIVSTHCEGVCDISWSSDSKRFVVGTIDSSVLIYEDKNYQSNKCNPETHQKESDWAQVFRNSADHTQFVQGVAYDPLDVYIASMGSDRTVRVFSRKSPPKTKKKILRQSNSQEISIMPSAEEQVRVAQILTEARLDMGKSKKVKYRCTTVDDEGTQVKQKLFADESTLESFFRRLSWTTDGAFLVTPAALWHKDPTTNESSNIPPSFSTYLFARHRFEEPYKVLTGLEKPSVVVRPNPVLFQLPKQAQSDIKENDSSSSSSSTQFNNGTSKTLPYRSIFAVLTLDSVLVYDTYHDHPLAVVRGLHYAGLTDCSWSSDGKNLVVCSTDGYVSFLSFEHSDLGEPYIPPIATLVAVPDSTTTSATTATTTTQPEEIITPVETTPLPPCEPGHAVTIDARPTKRTKKTRITPTLISTTITTPVVAGDDEKKEDDNDSGRRSPSVKRAAETTDTDGVGAGVDKLSLQSSDEKPKKKKRIQPILISSN